MTRRFTPYTETYKEKCFITWYQLGRPDNVYEVLEKFPPDEHERRPSKRVLRLWRIEDGWDNKADVLDTEAKSLVYGSLITEKAEMLRRHAKMGYDLMSAGMAHISSGTFDSSSAAVSAVIRGAELERESRGIGELIVKMSKMSEEDLKQEIMRRIARASENGQIIDAGEVDTTTDEQTT